MGLAIQLDLADRANRRYLSIFRFGQVAIARQFVKDSVDAPPLALFGGEELRLALPLGLKEPNLRLLPGEITH
jgi:hypothetical protein